MSNPESLLVVIDTNVLLVSISSRSKYHWIFQALISGDFDIGITQSILLEYEEQISKHWNPEVAANVIRSITELPNAKLVSIHYYLDLIKVDQDDNKFVDCAFAANADYILTHDQHFNILKEISFPRIPVITINEFRTLLNT